MRFRPAQGAVRVFPPQKGRPAGRRRDQQGVTAPEAIPDLTIVFSLAFAIFWIMRIYANLCEFMPIYANLCYAPLEIGGPFCPLMPSPLRHILKGGSSLPLFARQSRPGPA